MNKKIGESIKNLKILVIGDVMLDEYLEGPSKRISPEAPALIINNPKTQCGLGGAGNLALNMKKLGAKIDLVSVVGDDESGEVLKKIAGEEKINFDPIVVNKRFTTRKQRVISGNRQILRLDFEHTDELSKETEDKVLDLLKKYKKDEFDGIILSDYNKGFFTKKINDFINENFEAIKFADIKPENAKIFKGFDFIKMNIKELQRYFADKMIIENTDEFLEKNAATIIKHFPNLFLTRGAEGMSFFFNKDKIFHDRVAAKSVFDVTGAGDTVTSVFLTYYLASKNIEDSVQIANKAASYIISKPKCAAINLSELQNLYDPINNKIVKSDKALEEVIQDLKKQGKKVVLTSGCFDFVHNGHIYCFQRASSLGDVLIVGINADARIKELKGDDRPILDQDTRAYILAGLGSIDYVTIFEEDTPAELIDRIKPDVFVKGGDYDISKLPEAPNVKNGGGRIVIIKPDEDGQTNSSSAIINKIKNGK